jgi:hypothetical protein
MDPNAQQQPAPNPFRDIDFGAGSNPMQSSRPSLMNYPQTPQAQQAPDDPMGDFMKEYNQMRSLPSGQSNQQYKDILAQQPKREDYQPTKMNRLAAALAGFGEGIQKGPMAGISASNAMLDDRYNVANTDWQNRAKRLSEAASLEDKETTGMQTSYRDFLRARDQKADNTRLEKQNADRAAHTAAMDNLAEWKSKNPTGKVYAVPGGNLHVVDGFGKDTDTGVASGLMTKAEEIRLGVDRDLKKIEAQGKENRLTEETKQAGRDKLAKFKVDHPNLKLYAVRGGNVMGFNPQTNEMEDTGVDSGLATAEKLIEARGDQARQTNAAKASTGSTTTTTISDDGKSKTVDVNPKPRAVTAPMQKPIPGIPGAVAESKDGGKTWKRVK